MEGILKQLTKAYPFFSLAFHSRDDNGLELDHLFKLIRIWKGFRFYTLGIRPNY